MVRLARSVIPKSSHKQHKHAAIIMRGGAPLATGYNHGFQHAEVMAVNQLWPNKRRNTTVWSIRVTKAGKLAMAKPCANCERYMRESGVKTVMYSDDAGTIQRMRL